MARSPHRTLQWILAAVMVFSLVWAVWPFLSNPTSVTEAYKSAGALAPLVFIILVAVAPTPGAIIGASGGGYFGLWQGMFLLYVGNVLAAAITFGIVRWLGRPAAERVFEAEKLDKWDGFIARHPFMLWVVYAFPIFPLELITSMVALSKRPFWRFMLIPVMALPIDSYIVSTIGATLATRYKVLFEYASIAIVLLLAYGILHIFYRYKRKEIIEVGKKVRDEVEKRVVEPAVNFTKGTHKHVVKPVGRLTVKTGKHVKKGVDKLRNR